MSHMGHNSKVPICIEIRPYLRGILFNSFPNFSSNFNFFFFSYTNSWGKRVAQVEPTRSRPGWDLVGSTCTTFKPTWVTWQSSGFNLIEISTRLKPRPGWDLVGSTCTTFKSTVVTWQSRGFNLVEISTRLRSRGFNLYYIWLNFSNLAIQWVQPGCYLNQVQISTRLRSRGFNLYYI